MKEKYISRVDSVKSKMYGYLLRLYKGKGVLFQQWFPDKSYGGKDKSLKEAITVRDKKIIELNYNPNAKENRPWKPVLMDRKPKSNTGHLGIYESGYRKKRKNGTEVEYRYFAVSYVEDKGRSKIKRFYINRQQSRDEALEKAIEFRNSKEISARMAAVEYNRKLEKRRIAEENTMNTEKKRLPSKKR